MRLNFWVAAATALALAVPALAAGSDTAAVVPRGVLPRCGLLCTVELVPPVCGSLANMTCICTNTVLAPQLTACVSANCTKREALATKKYSDQSCGRPVNDRSLPVVVVTPLFGILALFVFGLRVLARSLIGWNSWGWDDWLLIPCAVLSIPMTIISGLLVKYGLGKDLWMVDPDNITEILYLYFWDEMMYLFIIPLTKISILAFYLRIFPREGFRKCCWVLIAGNVGYLIAFQVITVIQCTPIEGAWRHWDGEFEATCRDVNLQAWVAAAGCLVLDIATIVLPLPELWKLNMSWKKKIQVLSMFCVGFFVTLVAILRLQYLLHFGQGGNVTMDFVEVGIWSTIEVSVGIICACMPALRSLLSLAMPHVFGTTPRPTADASGGNINKSGNSNASSGLSSNIKVKSEYSVRSKQRDESTFVELHPFDDDDKHKVASRTNLVRTNTGARSERLDDDDDFSRPL